MNVEGGQWRLHPSATGRRTRVCCRRGMRASSAGRSAAAARAMAYHRKWRRAPTDVARPLVVMS